MITNTPQDGEEIVKESKNSFGEKKLIPTVEFSNFLDDITSSVNGITESPSGQFLDNILGAQFNDLINRIGSGELLTSDTASFTVDSNRFTVDMTEA
jgi:hypothetical protein